MRLIDIESESFLNEMREKQNACKELIHSSDGETPTWTERDHWEGVYGIFVEMALTLKKQPTVDAAPVKHGLWERQELAPPSYLFCSECGFPKKRGTWKFCPNCGSLMDLEDWMPKKKPETVPVSNDLCTILICAVRYSLGRRTYMPGLVTGWIKENMKGKLPRGTIEVMRRDIREQREMGERGGYEALGDACDVRTWTDFETWLIMEENGHEEK